MKEYMIVKVQFNVSSKTCTGKLYTFLAYDKNEYILKQAQANAELSDQLTETQLALCDVYEMIQ